MDLPPRSSETASPPDPGGAEGILCGTRIRTLDGDLPVEFLEPGDRVITRNGAVRLMSVTTHLRRSCAVVRLGASTIGHRRPEADLMLSPGQRVMIRDWRARSLYGSASAAVPAARLADGELVRHEILSLARLFALHFAEDEVIYAEGQELACLALTAASQPV